METLITAAARSLAAALITAAARSLAAGDSLRALKRVVLRDDAPAPALRGARWRSEHRGEALAIAVPPWSAGFDVARLHADADEALEKRSCLLHPAVDGGDLKVRGKPCRSAFGIRNA